MFNPLALMSTEALQGMQAAGNLFFVRQQMHHDTLPAGIKACFLLCHYSSFAKAREHYDVLIQDPYRRLYCWEEEKDRVDLLKAAAQPEGYLVYTNTFVPDWERQLTRGLKTKIRNYVAKLGWKPGARQGIRPHFFPYFGEIYVSLSFQKQEVRVRWQDIELQP